MDMFSGHFPGSVLSFILIFTSHCHQSRQYHHIPWWSFRAPGVADMYLRAKVERVTLIQVVFNRSTSQWNTPLISPFYHMTHSFMTCALILSLQVAKQPLLPCYYSCLKTGSSILDIIHIITNILGFIK